MHLPGLRHTCICLEKDQCFYDCIGSSVGNETEPAYTQPFSVRLSHRFLGGGGIFWSAIWHGLMFLNLCCIFVCGDERQAWGNFLYTKQRGRRVDWSLLVYWSMKLSVLLDSPGQLWFSLWTQPSASTSHLWITSAMKLDYTELSQTDLLHFEWPEGWNKTTGREPPVWQDHDFFIQFCCIVRFIAKCNKSFCCAPL
jgi:hypothetical protein